MDFELNETQDAYVAMAVKFAAKALAPKAAEWDAAGHFPRDMLREAGGLGKCPAASHSAAFGARALTKLTGHGHIGVLRFVGFKIHGRPSALGQWTCSAASGRRVVFQRAVMGFDFRIETRRILPWADRRRSCPTR